jgi:hypothetical protein
VKTRQNFKIAREANLVLSFGKVRPVLNFRPQNHWFAVATAREKIGKISQSLVMVWLYNEVRTYFSSEGGSASG